jgi:hypothetical protein
MTQEVIVFIILGIVVSYFVFTLFRRPLSNKPPACDGCAGCDLKKDLSCSLSEPITEKRKTKTTNDKR